MSNITGPSSLPHSASDNDMENNNNKTNNNSIPANSNAIDPSDEHEFLDYKDDLSYTSEDNLQDAINEKVVTTSKLNKNNFFY